MARILIIDDDAQVRRLLMAVLKQAGHQVVEASDGGKGLALHREQPADLILTDIVMPGQEGFETIQALREEFSHTKIIAFSGKTGAMQIDILGIAKKLGAHQTLSKPFEIPTLLHMISKELNEPVTVESAL